MKKHFTKKSKRNKNMAKKVDTVVTNDDNTKQSFSSDSSQGGATILKVKTGVSYTFEVDGSGTPGTITVIAGSPTVTGVDTKFMSVTKVGDRITANGETRTVASIESDTSLTTDAWTSAASNVTYTIAQ